MGEALLSIVVNGKITYVLWNDKRGDQLVPLKSGSTHSSFMLCQQNGAFLQNGTNTMQISNFD